MGYSFNIIRRQCFSDVKIKNKPPVYRQAGVKVCWDMDMVVKSRAGRGVELPAEDVPTDGLPERNMAALGMSWDVRDTNIDNDSHRMRHNINSDGSWTELWGWVEPRLRETEEERDPCLPHSKQKDRRGGAGHQGRSSDKSRPVGRVILEEATVLAESSSVVSFGAPRVLQFH